MEIKRASRRLFGNFFRRWIPTYISYTCKGIAVIIAYHIQKIITAFYSATRGGLMVFRSLFAILDRRGIVHVDHNETCDRCPRAREPSRR